MENEIMYNEEVVETAEEVVKNNSINVKKLMTGVGVAAVVAVAGYIVVKKIAAKCKAKKEMAQIAETEDVISEDVEYVCEDSND